MANGRTALGAAAFLVALNLAIPGFAADQSPIEITVGKDNTKRAITPGAGGQSGQSFRDCPNCPEMVVIPVGTFMMGSPENEPGHRHNEGPQHKVTFAKPFAVAKFELSWAEWDICNQDKKNECAPGDANCVPRNEPYCYKSEADEKWGRDKRPLINADYRALDQYLRWLKEKTGKEYRLLTEAEWEYAARAGSTSAYPTGTSLTKQQARFNEKPWSVTGKTAETGSFAPNAFGLHDMNGNVWEWVQDCWRSNYDGAPQDGSRWFERGKDWKPMGTCTITSGNRVLRDGVWTYQNCPEESCDAGHVLRGGSWSSDPRFVRSAYRTAAQPNDKRSYFGFRLARSLD